MTRLALGLLSALALTGCTTLQAHVLAHQQASGLYAIESYRARTKEQGILRQAPGAMVEKELVYLHPFKVRAQVVAPEEQAGELFCFDGSTLSLWWPRYFFGIRIRGVEVPPRNEVGDAILANCHWLLERYDFEQLEPTIHAGRLVDVYVGEPDDDAGPACRPYRAWIDRTYHLPLRLEASEQGQPWYAVAFDPIEFGAPVPEDAFAFEFPEGAVVHDWDLADPGVGIEEAQARVEFPILLPQALPPGHEVHKIVVSEGQDMDMVALLMNRRGHWLSLSEVPNMGPILVPAVGIPVTIGAEEGILNFVFGYTIVSWARGTTHLTLIGNLPYPQMLEIAASVGPAAGAEN